jgi:hypothetical protein
VSKFVNHSIRARRRASLIEHLIEYFDRHVEMLINEGVPPDRIAEALRLTTVRVEILYGGGTGEDRQASRSQTWVCDHGSPLRIGR